MILFPMAAWLDSSLARVSLTVLAPKPCALTLRQSSLDNVTQTTLTLTPPKGASVITRLDAGDPVVEVDVLQDGRGPALVFLRMQGNHTSAEVFRAGRNGLKQVWSDSSSGPIEFKNFGSFAEILVSRYGHQVGLGRNTARTDRLYQEVYIARQGRVRWQGVRNARASATRTLKKELIPGLGR